MNTNTMKLTLAAILMGGIAQAQTNWSWTFQRWGDTCGLLFADTNLTDSVKATIRDDLAYAYTFSKKDNHYTKIYTPNDSQYGTFIGSDGLQGNKGCPADISGWWYTLHNGNRYFHVKKELSEKYLQQIALTNQHKVAVGSLSNFLATVNSVTPNNVNPAKYLPLWWSMGQQKPLSMTYSRYEDEQLFFPSTEEFLLFCGKISEYEVIVPSILMFRQDVERYGGVFWCETVFRKRDDGEYTWTFIDIAYCDGKWRLVLPEL